MRDGQDDAFCWFFGPDRSGPRQADRERVERQIAVPGRALGHERQELSRCYPLLCFLQCERYGRVCGRSDDERVGSRDASRIGAADANAVVGGLFLGDGRSLDVARDRGRDERGVRRLEQSAGLRKAGLDRSVDRTSGGASGQHKGRRRYDDQRTHVRFLRCWRGLEACFDVGAHLIAACFGADDVRREREPGEILLPGLFDAQIRLNLGMGKDRLRGDRDFVELGQVRDDVHGAMPLRFRHGIFARMGWTFDRAGHAGQRDADRTGVAAPRMGGVVVIGSAHVVGDRVITADHVAGALDDEVVMLLVEIGCSIGAGAPLPKRTWDLDLVLIVVVNSGALLALAIFHDLTVKGPNADVSVTKFDQMVSDRRMPRPKRIDGCVVWDRLMIDAAFSDLHDENHNRIDELLSGAADRRATAFDNAKKR